MHVQPVNNQPNFGINLINKGSWNPKVLKAFEDSKILKDIDAKYPNAEAYYDFMNDAEWDMINSESFFTTLFDITLEPGRHFRWSLSSHNEAVTDKYLIEKLETLTLEEIEKKSVLEPAPIATLNITKKKPSFLKELANKLFGRKQNI